jgi:PleD family two-component response regulator
MEGVSKASVLLVDDEVRWVMRMAQQLAKSGLDVGVCHDGTTALRVADESPPDVILLRSARFEVPVDTCWPESTRSLRGEDPARR